MHTSIYVRGLNDLKETEKVRLRFRLTDGRNVKLYHKTGEVVSVSSLRDFEPDGRLKARKTIYDHKLKDIILTHIAAMEKVYKDNPTINPKDFDTEVDKVINPKKYVKERESKDKTLLENLGDFINDQYKDGLICLGRKRHYDVLAKELYRYLVVNNKVDMLCKDFTPDMLSSFREFLINEYSYVDNFPQMYAGMKDVNVPKAPRSLNTVATKIKSLRTFFNEMCVSEVITCSPFNRISANKRKKFFKEEYNEPIALTIEELNIIRNTDVPQSLQSTKIAFIVNCTLGLRVHDFARLSMDNISVEDGIPYLHYIPQKTSHISKEEIKTPLLLSTLNIIKECKFDFPILRNIFGKSGYNVKIKELVKYCGIDRLVPIYNAETKDNDHLPLCDFVSSKTSRKTFASVMSKSIINLYASGLHKVGSEAARAYVGTTLRDRFVVACMAFGEDVYQVDENLNIIK